MIPYIGGKSFLSRWIIDNFPEDYKERTYVEVFGGGGWVMFKKEPSYLEVYNDLNSNLVNLFRVIRDSYPEFSHRAQWCLHSREMYQEAREKLKEDKFLGEVEKAMFYAIDRVQSFAGNGGWAYQVTAAKVVSGKWSPFLRRLELINARLKNVQIECIDFEKCIQKYDNKMALFYLDPPYVDAEKYYNNAEVCFARKDHERLARILKKLKGKFVLSYYENPLVRELYSGYRIIEKQSVKHSQGCTVNMPKRTKASTVELLIMNY